MGHLYRWRQNSRDREEIFTDKSVYATIKYDKCEKTCITGLHVALYVVTFGYLCSV
jgi:hypothetical protein